MKLDRLKGHTRLLMQREEKSFHKNPSNDKYTYTYTTEEVFNVGILHLTWAPAISARILHEKALKGLSTC